MSTTSTHIVLGGNGVVGRETLRALSGRGITPRVAGPHSLNNPYAYGRTKGPMTEKNQIHPSSRKGKVRAAALGLLDEAARSRGLIHTVGRSADFYGPGATTSVFNTFALDKVAAGKKPTWFFDATQPHSLTFTRDIGDALVILGTDPRAPGREWHLPTARPALTGEQYVSIAVGGRADHHTMSALMIRIEAVFNSSARETLEMSYEFVEPYRFDSNTFETTFHMHPTPYEDGIAHTLAACHDTPAASHAPTESGSPPNDELAADSVPRQIGKGR